jgi:integrase
MFGGIKTDAGRNRYVPIHPLILPLIEARYNTHNEYLFNDEDGQQGTSMTYDKYRKRFTKVMTRLKFIHHPQETRHTFITKAKEANIDEYMLKLIVGHAIHDITEKVYTHRTMEQLQKEIIKIFR